MGGRWRSLRRLAILSRAAAVVLIGCCALVFGLLQTLPGPVADQAWAARVLGVEVQAQTTRGQVLVGDESPIAVRCRAVGGRDVGIVGHSLRFLVERGRVRQTAGRPVRKGWLVALSVLAGCPNQIRRLLGQRLAVGFSRGQLHLLEPDRAKQVRIYEILVSRRPLIELEANQATFQLTGAELQGLDLNIQSRFFSAIARSSVDVRAPVVH